MDKAIGLVEYKTVATGITASDEMIKTAHVELLMAQTVCPGKFIALIAGDLSAVKAAIEVGKSKYEYNLIDSFILGNPHESIFSAMNATAKFGNSGALGIVETYSAATAIVAADIAAKTAKVNILELRIARGMAGKSFVLISGEIAAVEASVQAAIQMVKEEGMLIDMSIIPNPDPKLWETLV
ncbi:BMC domain-containing protein [Clostridium grantii]|uniref:Carboxysome shell and ethanolamine utilization microcompartment protein CcmL/EutN n=1 Tax=Clostridium grantii DSM 8605 TaxID=1121316 RepID=A0A1M5SXL8_9CLOT|nr:BMC domain-containing protein [Clostridium grantii]SHH43274.1 Carboxysome shell and ethanolamine utilization microcompartment protein CcmL/EutN [Clostridium grantii DSM 8605]